MAFSTAQQLQELGVATPLAKELGAQIDAGSYSWRRLMWSSMPVQLAKYVSDALASGTFSAVRGANLGMTPSVASYVLTRAGGAWRPNLLSFKAFLAANAGADNPHSLPAMPVPPTVTKSNNGSLMTGLTVVTPWVSNQNFYRPPLGRDEAFGTNYRRFIPALRNASVQERNQAWRIEADITGQNIGIGVLGHTGDGYRFIVNGQYVSFANEVTSTNAGQNYFKLAFSGSAKRRFAVEGMVDEGFTGFYTDTGGLIENFTFDNFRTIFLGDSFTEAAQIAARGDSYGRIVADGLGIRECVSSGVGTAGILNNVSGTRYTLGERLLAGEVTQQGTFPIVFTAEGHNDINTGVTQAQLEAEFNLDLDRIRSANPACLIFVIGPWDSAAPSAPIAGYSVVKTALQNCVATRGGVYFIDMQGIAYTKADAVHPDAAGHVTLANYITTTVRSIVASS